MALVDPSTLALGQTIKFKSVSDHDNVMWEGKVTGLCLYDQARKTTDILPYYREVAKRVKDLPPIEELRFFTLQYLENNTRSVTNVFAIEYIDPSTLVINDPYTTIAVKIYGSAASEIPTILGLLNTHGYRAYLDS